ncbi:hypothetical protein ACL02U_05440 [Streptomyces sp. MS06]|uniref:hypothetical protein n=1 Tax=Streptomyces sp. MS06 TaxID=3385974 RepID=UPI0039A39F30
MLRSAPWGLHFGMTLEEITRVLGKGPAVSSYSHHGEDQQLNYADFAESGIRALFRDGRLGCGVNDAAGYLGPLGVGDARASPGAVGTEAGTERSRGTLNIYTHLWPDSEERTRAAVDKAYADQSADAQPQVDEAA